MQTNALAIVTTIILSACNRPSSAPPEPEAVEVQQFVKAGASFNLVAEGERLTHVLGCKGCHGSNLQGAVWDEEPEFGIVAPSNLDRAMLRQVAKDFDDAAAEASEAESS